MNNHDEEQLFTEIYHCLLLEGIVPEREIEAEVHAIMDTPARLLEFTSSL